MELRFYQTSMDCTTWDDRLDEKVKHTLLSNPVLQYRENVAYPWVTVPVIIEDIRNGHA